VSDESHDRAAQAHVDFVAWCKEHPEAAAAEIQRLRRENAKLSHDAYLTSWEKNPDRMGS
jgi:ABC-type nitrate/sulfonate/bicarbonate transport system substrate-binding protein